MDIILYYFNTGICFFIHKASLGGQTLTPLVGETISDINHFAQVVINQRKHDCLSTYLRPPMPETFFYHYIITRLSLEII